jgi:hypothetical protein
MKQEIKVCQNCKKDFTIESDDFSFYEKMKVPPPTFCPMCRAERRLTFRNERKLFKAKDSFSGEDIFSIYPNEGGRKVVKQETWYGDSWDAMDYGTDYNFSRSFFSQIKELLQKVPIFNQNANFMVNSPYSANATALKNCYLCFGSNYSEDCMYGNAIDFSKDSIDNSHLNHSERCYECFWVQNCYQCYFTIMSIESNNLWFCRDCLGCNNCFGCANLRKSSYCIFNKQYGKVDYENELKKMQLHTISGIMKTREIVRGFWMTKPIKCHQGLKNVDSSGSYVTNCKNVRDSFLVREGENLRYCQYLQVPKTKDCYDTTVWGNMMELNYETCLCGENSFNVKFSTNCWPSCKNIEYSFDLFSCSDCFGCVGLKKKQYCVFNKQYTKDGYETLVEKIKKQMNEIFYTDKRGNIYKYGEFFPIELSYFGYNNTCGIDHFDMTKEEAFRNGYPWIEVERGKYNITKKATDLPDLIDNIDENILNEIIECSNCKNAYRILENELTFYKKEKIPIPILCSECRHKRRIADRLKFQLYKRKCMCTGYTDDTGQYNNTGSHLHNYSHCVEEFKTGYSPTRKEIIYCEKCYQQEVY